MGFFSKFTKNDQKKRLIEDLISGFENEKYKLRTIENLDNEKIKNILREKILVSVFSHNVNTLNDANSFLFQKKSEYLKICADHGWNPTEKDMYKIFGRTISDIKKSALFNTDDINEVFNHFDIKTPFYRRNNFEPTILWMNTRDLNEENAENWYSSAKGILSLTSNYYEALKAIDKSLMIKPNYKDAWILKGDILYEISLYDQAEECKKYANKLKIG